MARYSGTSMIAVDRAARVTTVVGKSNHDVAFDPQNAAGKSVDSYFVNDPEYAELYHKALKNQPQKVTFRGIDGGYYEAQVVPLFDEKNKVCGAFSFEHDVTEREKAIEMHKEQKEKLERLFQNAEDGFYLLDSNFVIQRSNATAASIHKTEGPVEGHVCHQRIFGRDTPCDVCPVIKTLHTGQSAEVSYFDEDIQKHLQLRSAPLFDPLTGELTGVFETVRDISDTVAFETAVQSHELFITDIFASIQDGVFIIDPAYNIIKTNPAFDVMYPEYLPLVGQKCFVTSGLDRVCDGCPAVTTFETGKTEMAVHYEQPTATKPGMWLEHFAYPITAPSGDVVAVICVIRDITKRKEDEDALKAYRDNLEELVNERTRDLEQSESKMRMIISGGNVPIAFAGPDGSLTFANTAFQTLTGYAETDLVGARLWDTIYDDQTKADCRFIEKRVAFYTGEIDQHRQDITIRRQNGETRWIDFTASAVRNSEGKRIQAIFILQDITERYTIEKAVEDANERARLMLDATPLCATLWDEQLKPIDCNLEAIKLFGAKDKQEYLDRFFELFPKYQPNGKLSIESVDETVKAAFETGYLRFEVMHQKLDGTPLPAEVTIVRVQRGDGYIAVGYARDLREEKKMLAEIHDANERTQIMLDATPLGCTFLDKRGKVVDCNPAMFQLFGFTDKQECIDRFWKVAPKYQPDGRLTAERVAVKIAATIESGLQRFEWLHQKLDGTLIPCEVTLVCVRQGDDPIIAGYTRDLREHKAMLAKMRETDERAQIMLDSMPLGCNLWDDQLNNIDCNMAAVKLFDLKNKQEYLERFRELSPEYQPDGRLSREKGAEKILEAFRDGYCQLEWMHRKFDGTLIPVEVTLVCVQRGSGYIVAGYTRDLRELKKHEAEQERDQQRTNALLELAQMTQQPADEITDYVIRTIVSLTDSTMGYVLQLEDAADVLPFRSLVADQSVACAMPTVTENGTPHTLSVTLTECLSTKGAVIHDDVGALPGIRTFPMGHCEVRSHMNVPIMDGEKPVGVIGVGNKETPYTETDTKQLTLLAQGLGNLLNRKKYAKKLEIAKNEAENANRAKSEFLAHMSHEIRTPLNGVIGLSDLLAGTPLNEKQREYVQLINASGNALLFLINDILDFSKIEAGKLEIDSEPFDLSATTGSVLASLIPRASEKNLELAVSFCRNLPRIVVGDSGRIRQILLNLVGNAVKFTEHGGVRINIAIESVGKTSLVVKFCVIDTGIGIPQSGIDRLFKAFSQVDASSARIYGGTGLGLAISMQLVRLMSGDIGVESIEGKGSRFWFSIPFGCDPEALQCLREERCIKTPVLGCPNVDGQYCTVFVNREIPGEYCIKGHSVLIVDDNEIQRDALRIQLENWEMKCTVCGSGEEALRLAEEHRNQEKPFALFVIDSTLSDGPGVDLARQLLEQEMQHGMQAVQIILLRSFADDFDQDILNDDRTEIVSKPVFASVLFDAVINRIFAAKEQQCIDSGIVTSSGTRLAKPKPRWQTEAAKHSQNLASRLKSHLAGTVHVLVVEDNRVNQVVAKNLLTEAGFTCDIAQNGIEACSAVRNTKYDTILMDCQMPEMDGYEATRLIRNWEREHGKKHLPIIALTANATKEDVQKCLEAGMDAYCSKPINPQAVIQLIEEWCEKRD